MGGNVFQEGPSLGDAGFAKSCYSVASVLRKPTETTGNRGESQEMRQSNETTEFLLCL